MIHSLVLKQGLPGCRGRVPQRCRQCRRTGCKKTKKILGEVKQDRKVDKENTTYILHKQSQRCMLLPKDRNVQLKTSSLRPTHKRATEPNSVRSCGGLNKNGLVRLVCDYLIPSKTIWEGFEDVALVEVCHWQWF